MTFIYYMIIIIQGKPCLQAASQLATLSPEIYFTNAGSPGTSQALSGDGNSQLLPAHPLPSPFLTRSQVRAYEAQLKALLLAWASGGCQEGRAAAAAALAAIRSKSYQEPVEHPSNLGVSERVLPVLLPV